MRFLFSFAYFVVVFKETMTMGVVMFVSLIKKHIYLIEQIL